MSLFTQDDELFETVIALLQPIPVGIGRDGGPSVGGMDALNAAEVLDPGEFVLAGEVVADVVKVDFSALGGLGVLHQERDGDGGAGAEPEDVAAFLAALLAGGAAVAAQVEDVDAGELLGQALAQAVGGVGFDEAGVGDEADNATGADAVRSPADGADVTVVERVLERGCGALGVGLADALVEAGVRDVLVVVVGAALPHRVRGVADDHAVEF